MQLAREEVGNELGHILTPGAKRRDVNLHAAQAVIEIRAKQTSLDEFLPPNLERVLYLDSDVLAEENFAALFSMNLQDNVFAAVL